MIRLPPRSTRTDTLFPYTTLFRSVEDALKDFYGTVHAIVFSTGYQANLGVVSTLAAKGDYIILDADSHASIYDGCYLGNADIVRFRHNSVEDLDKRLGRLPAEAGKLVILRSEERRVGKECVSTCRSR